MQNFDLFETLIFIGESLAEFMTKIWTWFTTTYTLGQYTFKPIESLPIVGVSLLVLWLIKTFLPAA